MERGVAAKGMIEQQPIKVAGDSGEMGSKQAAGLFNS